MRILSVALLLVLADVRTNGSVLCAQECQLYLFNLPTGAEGAAAESGLALHVIQEGGQVFLAVDAVAVLWVAQWLEPPGFVPVPERPRRDAKELCRLPDVQIVGEARGAGLWHRRLP